MLTDLSPMPFGKYKGIPMQDVEPSYLHYLWDKLSFKKFVSHPRPPDANIHQLNSWLVAQYIDISVSALKMENPDLIW